MISSSDYNSIMREYDELQRQDRADRDARVEEVYSRVPEIKELDESRGTIALAIIRQAGSGTAAGRSDSDSASGAAASNGTPMISDAFKKIAEKKAALLKQAGFPADYMEMKYHCPDCRDTGYTDGAKCHCLIEKENRLLYAQSGIRKILGRENFDTLDESVYSEPEHMTKVVMYAKKYVSDFGKGTTKNNLVFTGNTGVGKTFLCNCIAKELMDKNLSVIYLSAIELFDVMAKIRVQHSDDVMLNEMYERIFDCDLLVIDDLGSELTNSLANSNLFFLLNSRILSEKATIISTNLSIDAMRDIYTERVTSRVISAYDIIPVIGKDIRMHD